MLERADPTEELTPSESLEAIDNRSEGISVGGHVGLPCVLGGVCARPEESKLTPGNSTTAPDLVDCGVYCFSTRDARAGARHHAEVQVPFPVR